MILIYRFEVRKKLWIYSDSAAFLFSLLSYTGDILIVGITYDKKDKMHKCEIEKYEK